MTARSAHLQVWFYKETLIINIGILEGPINDISFPHLTSEGVRQMEVKNKASLEVYGLHVAKVGLPNPKLWN